MSNWHSIVVFKNNLRPILASIYLNVMLGINISTVDRSTHSPGLHESETL